MSRCQQWVCVAMALDVSAVLQSNRTLILYGPPTLNDQQLGWLSERTEALVEEALA